MIGLSYGSFASSGGAGFIGLLDEYPNAAAAYSVRRLSSTYEASLIEVRRSSDNTTQDIGYDSNGDLDTTALLSFVGAGDGFVRTWYDQSGNANNATQTTTSLQPLLISGGVINLSNSKAALSTDGTQTMVRSSLITSGDLSLFIAKENTNIVSLPQDYVSQSAANPTGGYKYGISGRGDYQLAIYPGSTYAPTDGASTLNEELHTLINTSSTTTLHINSASKIITPNGGQAISNASNAYLFSRNGVLGFSIVNCNEIVVYNANKTADRLGIETNINNYYSIY